MFNNTQLQQAVHEELRFDPSFADSDIAVAATDGAVALTGYVPSYAEKRFASKAAQRVGGVRKVTNEIKVRLPMSPKLTDQELSARVMQSLEWDASVPPPIRATVKDGMVTLTGDAPFRFQKTAAELNVGKLYGVTGIINDIAVKPTSGSAAHTQADISKALERLAFEGKGITVTAEDGKVSLTGTVPNAYQRELAEHVAWSAPGVTQVTDRLSIN